MTVESGSNQSEAVAAAATATTLAAVAATVESETTGCGTAAATSASGEDLDSIFTVTLGCPSAHSMGFAKGHLLSTDPRDTAPLIRLSTLTD